MSGSFNSVIFQAKIALSETIPLSVYLVKGSSYAVWIDSGVRSMFPLLQETMSLANVEPNDLRFVLHTHSHHDHIGNNAQLKAYTGCLIAAHPLYAAWHEDFERHYHEFARGLPSFIPDTPELRSEVLEILDAPAPLDIHLPEESMAFDLGGGVVLRSIWLPGHLLAEFGWIEESTHTLILGDAITGLDWEVFHSHLDVQSYRSSLNTIRHVLRTQTIEQVIAAHYPPMKPSETLALCDQADAYIDAIEATLLRVLAAADVVDVKTLWTELCQRMRRLQEFRSLNMVNAHLRDLEHRQIVRQITTNHYQLR